MNKGHLFILSAPSGAGKTTIVKPILQNLAAISFCVSHTTRQPRPGEVNGKDYFFVSVDQFVQMKEDNEFLEWAKVHNNFYGTSKQAVEAELEKGNDIILDIDVQGAAQLRNESETNATYIFIAPPSLDELGKRLEGRQTETKESLKIRLKNAGQEMQQAKHYDYIVINDQVEKACQTLQAIIIEKRIAGQRDLNGAPINLSDF